MADATEPLLGHNRIPTRCMNQEGLLLADEECFWIDLVPNYPSSQSLFAQYKINLDEGIVETGIKYNTTESLAHSLKKSFANDTSNLKRYLNNLGVENIEEIKTSNYDLPNRPYSIKTKSYSSIVKVQDQILIKPFLNFPQSENPFQSSERTYPIDLTHPKESSFTIMIEIPNGYEIVDTLKSINYNDDVIAIKYDAVNANGILRVIASYEFKKAVYQPEEYQNLKEGFDKIISKFNEYIVLEKND
jgi:hypothetical protein